MCFRGRLDRYACQFSDQYFENYAFIAFDASKIATFQDIPMHYQAISFFVSIGTLFYAPNAPQRSFLELRTIKQPKNMYHEVKLPKSQNWSFHLDITWPWPDPKSLKAQNDALGCWRLTSCQFMCSLWTRHRYFGRGMVIRGITEMAKHFVFDLIVQSTKLNMGRKTEKKIKGTSVMRHSMANFPLHLQFKSPKKKNDGILS